MKVQNFFLLLSITSLFIMGCQESTNPTSPSNDPYYEEQTQTLDAINLQHLLAETTDGNITITGTFENAIHLQISKTIHTPDPSEAEIYARKVNVRITQEENTLHIYKDQPHFPDYVQVEVAFNILCPISINADLTTLNGNINVKNMEAVVKAQTTTGDITLTGSPKYLTLRSTQGNIAATISQLQDTAQFLTSNGSITAIVEKGIAPLSAVTTNGSVEVTLPNNFSGQLEARTVNGNAQSTFDIQGPPANSPNTLYGTLGEGGNSSVILRAVNGNIHLWKSE